MFLRRIIVQNFKNIGSADISFSPKINCICGNNGEGKTNLLDAVHYLSMTKSFLSVNDRYTYTYGKDEAVLHGTFQDGDREEDIAVSVRSDGAKTVRRNGKAYKRLSEHIGRIPVVMTAPPDISLIHDSGEERRRFLNMMISQIDPEYLRSVSAYNSLLKQRNASLRQEGTPDLLLETISGRMCAPAAYIHARRREAAEQLAAKAAGYYGFISGGRESIGIRYRSDLEKAGLEELLAASQGQQKSFIIALKMAQYRVMCAGREVRPVLLFDDLFDKLDSGRVASLIRMVVEGDFGQIFITDTDEERLRRIVGGITDEGRFFNVSAGSITEKDGEPCRG